MNAIPDRTVIDINGADVLVLVIEHWKPLDVARITEIAHQLAAAFTGSAVKIAKFGPDFNIDDIDVRRLRLERGDKILARVSGSVPPEGLATLADALGKKLPNHEIIVYNDDIRLAVIHDTGAA